MVEDKIFYTIPASTNSGGFLTIDPEMNVGDLSMDFDGNEMVDTVLAPEQMADPGQVPDLGTSLQALRTFIENLDLADGIRSSFLSKVDSGIVSYQTGHTKPAKGKLKALMNQLHALSGKKIEASDAQGLINIAEGIYSKL